MCKLIIFDLDGTLIDSVKDLATAINYALNKFNFPIHEVFEYYYFVGDGVVKLIERALPNEYKNDNLMIQKVKKLFDEYYGKNFDTYTKPYNGIKEMLLQLKKTDSKLCVVSNKPHEFSCTIVNKFFPNIFDTIIGNSEKFEKKPSPDIVNYLREKYDIVTENCTIIGDSDVDIITGKNAQIKSIGVSWGFRGVEELQNANADFIAYSPEDILNFLING